MSYVLGKGNRTENEIPALSELTLDNGMKEKIPVINMKKKVKINQQWQGVCVWGGESGSFSAGALLAT